MIIAVDIDGVLTREKTIKNFLNLTHAEKEKAYWRMRPNKGNIKKIQKLYLKHDLYLFTSRIEAYRMTTELWLVFYKVPYNHMIMNKPYYDLIIDDKGVSKINLANIKRMM